jgi:hypothetical protein
MLSCYEIYGNRSMLNIENVWCIPLCYGRCPYFREGSTPEHVTSNRTNSNIQLCFLNYLKPPVYTDKDITDVNNKTIKVALFEGDKKITTGPFSKAQIEILVLHGGFYNKYRGSWTEEEFDKHIVQGRDEQAQVLGTVRLTNGEAELNQIQFREGSCRKKIVLAARVCKTENTPGGVLEAIMKPVEVKDRRNERMSQTFFMSFDCYFSFHVSCILSVKLLLNCCSQ